MTPHTECFKGRLMASDFAEMPKVSVVVPNYNHARYLGQRLASIGAQTHRNFELIVLDDASTDDSHTIIDQYAREHSIRFYPNNTNSGSPFHQWNRGVELARGEFIWIAESDDSSDPEFLATLVPRLEAEPAMAFAYSHSTYIDEEGTPCGSADHWLRDLDPDRWSHSWTNDGHDECARFLIRANTVPNASAVLFRRDRFRQIGGAPTHLRLSGDWLTWARLALTGTVGFEPARLNLFRCHRATVRGSSPLARQIDEAVLIRRELLTRCKVPMPARRAVATEATGHLLRRLRDAGSGGGLRTAVREWHRFAPLIGLAPGAALASGVRLVGSALGGICRRQFTGAPSTRPQP